MPPLWTLHQHGLTALRHGSGFPADIHTLLIVPPRDLVGTGGRLQRWTNRRTRHSLYGRQTDLQAALHVHRAQSRPHRMHRRA